MKKKLYKYEISVIFAKSTPWERVEKYTVYDTNIVNAKQQVYMTTPPYIRHRDIKGKRVKE